MRSIFFPQASGVALKGLMTAVLLAAPSLASSKDLLVTATRTGKIYVFDAAQRKLERTLTLPGGGTPWGIAPGPNGKILYVMNEANGAIHGVDFDTGAEVFSTHFSHDDIRANGMAGLAVTPDGKEIYATVFSTRLKKAEYEVLDPAVQVYSAAGGLEAKPIRSFPIPRQSGLLFFSADGSKLYSVGPDISILDPRTGATLGTLPVRSLQRPNMSSPDLLNVWMQYSQTNEWVSPIYSRRTDLPETDPHAFRTGMMTLDLVTGKTRVVDFEDTTSVIFSAVVNPANRDEVFSVYTQMSKVDLKTGTLVKRVDLDHTYYSVNISSDGKEVYAGGALADIDVRDPATLERIGSMQIPDQSNMSVAWMQIIKRD